VHKSDSAARVTSKPVQRIPEIDSPVIIGFCPFGDGYSQGMSDKPDKAFHGYSLSVMK
jgi:hypothetical protein